MLFSHVDREREVEQGFVDFSQLGLPPTSNELNAGISTQLLQTLFKVKAVVHYGIAGNADPQLQIGDVTIPQFWAHTGLWNWQNFGSLEAEVGSFA
nr:bark storage protein A-like [Malus domestica]